MESDLAARIVATVRDHVEDVLANGRETTDEDTPLLADALDPSTGDPLAYDARDVAADRRLSNLAVQQEFLRTLLALDRLTGATRYHDVATDIVSWMFDHLTDGSGLVYWGGHAAYDVDAQETVVGKNDHELKYEYPFYELFFEVDPDGTRRFVEAMWSAHVIDWSILDFDRHGQFSAGDPAALWDHEYDGGDVLFWGDGLTFINAGSDLYYAAGMLSHHSDDERPLRWAQRLAHRYVQTRQEPGISGYQYSQHTSHCNGPEILGDRAQYQFAPYIHGDHRIFESTLFRPRPIVQRQQLALGDRLGPGGEPFLAWAIEELHAWAETAYRPEENVFEPMLTDGLSLEGFVIRREGYFGPKGRIVEPIEADWEFFWTYARAYRIAGDDRCWDTARNIANGLGLGDIGDPDGDDRALDPDAAVEDYAAIYGLLDLYDATGVESYRRAASRIGSTILETAENGQFLWGGRVDLEDPRPLALLHLAATLDEPDRERLPVPVGYRRTPSGGV